MEKKFSFALIKKAYLIGIKGAGMAALAEVLARRGVAVSGSDTEEHFFTDMILQDLHIPYVERFAPENIPADSDVVIYSTAYSAERNTEVAAALASGKAVLSYPQAIGELTAEHWTLAVAGTHGKTTTSALLAEVLREADLDPLAIVGSRILQWSGNALAGSGRHFVLEADEYQNKLQYYKPYGVILTSVDWDHPDFFPTPAAYEQAFVEFVRRIPRQGMLVACGDSASVDRVSREAGCRVASYGFLKSNTYQITEWRAGTDEAHPRAKQSFEILHEGESLGVFRLQLAGRHNALNATAVVAMCALLEVDIERVRQGLSDFQGTERRFERIGERSGVTVYDDYAHHPEEVKVTLRAFRELFPDRRIVAVFHPHTFTRTKALLQDFAQSFDDAGRVVVLDIYGSAREEQGGVSSRDLTDAINRYFHGRAEHVPDIDEALVLLRKETEPGDILVTLGAGNVWELGRKFLEG